MRKTLLAVLVIALLASGCGDGDESSDTTEAGPTTSSPAAPDTTSGGEAGGGTTPPAEAPVAIDGPVNDRGTADVPDDDTISITALDFAFDPTYVEGAAGREVTVEVRNDGGATHSFTTDSGIDEVLDPGATATVELQVPADAPLVYFCRFHRSQGMQGAFAAGDGATTDTSAIAGDGSGY